MTTQFRSRRYLVALGLLISYAVINFLFNVFVVGGSDFVYRLNSVLPPLWGALAIFLLIRLLIHERENEVSSRVYRWLVVGLGLWVLGDFIWGFYALVLHIETPYPSWADLVWIAGYPFIFLALYRRIRSYGVPLIKRDRWLLGAILGVMLLIALGFILIPNVRDYDPQRLGESILNIAYPLFDTMSLILTLIILFTLEKGKNALPWAVITLGFVFNAAADLMLYRAIWMGTYYPQGRATFTSVLIDNIYDLLYPCLCLGFYMVNDLVSVRAGISGQLAARPTPTVQRKVSFEIFTDARNLIISVSDNLVYLLKAVDKSKIIGLPFDAVLGIGQDEMQIIQRCLDENGYIREWPLALSDSAGQRSDTWLTGFPTRDLQGQFTGANFVLQAHKDDSFAAPPLSKESVLFVNSVLKETGILEEEREKTRAQALQSRFQAQMELLYELISSEGNRRIAKAMESACQQLARERGWPIQFSDGKAVVPAGCAPGMLEEAYPLLLTTAREHAVRILGEELVRTELEKLDSGLKEKSTL